MAKHKRSSSQPGPLARTLAQILSTFDELISGLKTLGLGPIREIRKFSRQGSSEGRRDSLVAQLFRLPWIIVLSILSVLIRVLLSPVELVAGLSRGRIAQSFSLTPWLVSLTVLILAVYYFGYRRSELRAQNLRLAAQEALVAEDYETAAANYEQLLTTTGSAEAPDRYAYAGVLIELQQTEQAMELLNQLAPGMGKPAGYPPAHRLAALTLAQNYRAEPNKDLLRIWKLHLDRGGDSADPLFNLAWADYYRAAQEPENALPYLNKVAERKPEFQMQVAELHRRLKEDALKRGNRGLAEAHLEAQTKAQQIARSYYAARVAEDPENIGNRILLAQNLVALDDDLEAESVLNDGPDTAELRKWRAGFYVNQFRKASDQAFSIRFQHLKKSLASNPLEQAAHEGLLKMYREETDPDHRAEIRDYVEKERETDPIAGSPEIRSLYNFTLSAIYFVDDRLEESRELLEQAYQDDDQLVISVNNLAWTISQSPEVTPAELERAESLARWAVAKHPNNGHLLDTLAEVLRRQERYDEAIAELQKALATISMRAKTHLKIAQIYRQLGKPDLAGEHERQASEASGN